VTALLKTRCEILLLLLLFLLSQHHLGVFGMIALGISVSNVDVKDTISFMDPQTSDKHITMVIIILLLMVVALNWVS